MRKFLKAFGPAVAFLTSSTALWAGSLPEVFDTPLAEVDATVATRNLNSALIMREKYGAGNGGVRVADFFDFAKAPVGHKSVGEVVGEELVVQAEDSTANPNILALANKIQFPFTLDLKFRAEVDSAGGYIQLMVAHDSKVSEPTISKGSFFDQITKKERVSFAEGTVYSYRFVFDQNGNGRVYDLETGTSFGLARMGFGADYDSLDIRFFKAKLYIREVAIYSETP